MMNRVQNYLWTMNTSRRWKRCVWLCQVTIRTYWNLFCPSPCRRAVYSLMILWSTIESVPVSNENKRVLAINYGQTEVRGIFSQLVIFLDFKSLGPHRFKFEPHEGCWFFHVSKLSSWLAEWLWFYTDAVSVLATLLRGHPRSFSSNQEFFIWESIIRIKLFFPLAAVYHISKIWEILVDNVRLCWKCVSIIIYTVSNVH